MTSAASYLRIAHVTSSLFEPLGGAEQYCIELAVTQAAEGHHVELFGAGASDELKRRLVAEGVKVRDLSRPRPYQPGTRGTRARAVVFHLADLIDSIITGPGMARRLSEEHDIVHVHRWQGLGTAPLRLRRVATVHTVHDYALVDTSATSLRDGGMPDRLPLPQRLRSKLIRRPLGNLDAVVFPTRRTRDRHAQLGLDLGERAVVVPHGWRLPPATPSAESSAPTSTITVTFMGKLIADKGVDMLLEAWGDAIPKARLVFAGAGDREPAILERTQKAEGVEFRGWLGKHAQSELLANTDLLVLPSLWPENFPLVVAEALLAGVPVLATAVSAPEILEDGRNAVIVAPNAQAIRSALQRIAADPTPLEPLRHGAVASAEALDMPRHSRAVLEVYDRALQHLRDRLNGSRP